MIRELRALLGRFSGLRRSARWAWGLSRDLPRRCRFQNIRALQRWSGRPVGSYASAGAYFNAHPAQGWVKAVRPHGTYARSEPRPHGGALPLGLSPPQRVYWPPEEVIHIAGARYAGAYGGSLITHDENLLGGYAPDVWGLERHALLGVFKLPPAVALPGVTAVISTPEADTNYSHWLMDLLPRLTLLADAGFGPECVDRYLINFGGHPYERETLAACGLPAEKCYAVTPRSHLRLEFAVSAALRPAHWQHTLPPWVPDKLRSILLPSSPDPDRRRRLYLSRRAASFRRVINEAELIPILTEFGFEVIDPGHLSVGAQAACFANAAAIISPHGSALTNLAFIPRGTPVLEVFAPDYIDVSFWTLATAVGAEYHACMGTRVGPQRNLTIEARRQDLKLEPLVLREFLNHRFGR